MATTLAAVDATDQHRRDQLAIRASAVQELLALWRTVDPTNLRGTIGTFTDAATALARRGFARSAAAAASYYVVYRQAEQVASTAPVLLATAASAAVVGSDLRGAALSGIVAGRQRGMTLGEASNNGLVKVTGALVKQVLAGGRMTIVGTAKKDPKVLGWLRATSGDPCAFCRMLASRGAVYKTQRAADFDTHDDCACTPEPLYKGDPMTEGAAAQAETYLWEYTTAQEWARLSGTMSRGTSNNALNNYRRWLANGSPEPGTPAGGQ